MNKNNILKDFNKTKCIITGGTGLIGRQLVNILCDAGASVTIISLDNIEIDKRAQHLNVDLCSFDECKKNIGESDFLFHLAGIKGSVEVTKSNPATFLVPLLMMNTNVLETARLNNIKKLAYTSSIGAYSSADIFFENNTIEGEPMDMFPGWAKRMAELQVQAYKKQYNLDWAVVRPCNVYGPGDNFDPNNAMVIPSILMKILKKQDPVIVWGDGSSVRDFAYSRDIAMGIILAIYYGTRGSFVNLGSGKGTSIKKLLETLNSFIDFNYKFDTSKSSGFPKRIMDISRARDWLGYSPSTTLKEGLKKTWGWLKENEDYYLKRKNYFK